MAGSVGRQHDGEVRLVNVIEMNICLSRYQLEPILTS